MDDPAVTSPDTPQGQEGGAQGQQTQPQFDVSAIQSAIRDGLRQIASEQPQQPQQQPYQPPVQQAADPVAQVLAPHLAPLTLQSQSAADAAIFYATTPKAAKYSAEIEQVAAGLHQRGILATRAEVYDLVKGRHLNDFVEETLLERQQAADAAQGATTVGVGSPQRGSAQVRQARDLSPEELEQAMTGMSF